MDTTHRPRMRARLSPLRSIGLACSAALATTAALAPVGGQALAATYSQPAPATGGGITVDGVRTDWTGTTAFAPLLDVKSCTRREGTLFLRYDPATGRLFAMVATEPGVSLQSKGDHMLSLDGTRAMGKGAGALVLSGDGQGWEAAAADVAPGTHQLVVRTLVVDGSPRTAGLCDDQATVVISGAASGASTAPDASTGPSDDPSAQPSDAAGASTEPSAQPSAQPSDDPGAGASTEPSAQPSDAATVSSDPTPSAQPSDAATVSSDPTPSAQPSDAATVSSDPTPSAQPSDKAGTATQPGASTDPLPSTVASDPATQASPDPSQGAVLGIVSSPATTLPPTDTLPQPSQSSGNATRIALLLLAAMLAGVALLPVRRPRQEDASGD